MDYNAECIVALAQKQVITDSKLQQSIILNLMAVCHEVKIIFA
jgi:hypothetical protein